MNKSLIILFLSSIAVGLVVVFSNNGIVQHHPEVFVIGLLAGLVFIYLEHRNASNKALNPQPPAAGTPQNGAH